MELAKALLGMLPSAPCQSVGVLKFGVFRGSIPGPQFLLSTLRIWPYGHARMTRSRCGSLGLHRTALASATSCRLDAVYIVPPVWLLLHLKSTMLAHRVDYDTSPPNGMLLVYVSRIRVYGRQRARNQ